MTVLIYFDVVWAIHEHDNIIEVFGGAHGVPKRVQFDSMLEFIKDDGYYPTLEDKLTHLVYSIIKNHYFVDGNKRSSIAIGAYFLQVNGLRGLVPRFILDMENVVLCVADDLITKEQLGKIITDIVNYGEMSESSKLLVVESVLEYNRRELERQ